jgi:HEAT repeat protein
MFRNAGPLCLAGAFLGLLLTLTPSAAQTPPAAAEGFITGTVAETWDKWQAAMQALMDRDNARTEAAFGDLLAANPSPFRLALLADRTVQRTPLAGAVLLMEQDLEAGALGPNGKVVAQHLLTGREQMNEADDGWYFCQVGRFEIAAANFQALLNAKPDAVAVLDFAGRVSNRRDVLLELVENPTVGESAREILRLLERGEEEIKADPNRIRENIERLGGPPRGFENAVQALKDSGEYAVPFMIQYLRDPTKRDLLQPILRCLPAIDRPAVNPLVIALRMDDQSTKRYVIEALGKIGYAQAVPYLLQVLQDSRTEAGVKQAINAALDQIRTHGTPIEGELSAAQAFYALGNDYYADKSSLAADVRLDWANVWYWRDNMLVNVPVPTPIFNEVMCLRCGEESLRLDSSLKPPLALWLAANFRREAQLPVGVQDPTRPENYPPAAYFAQSAGAEYCLMALARAIDTGDPAVALGAIAALRNTAGPASLISDTQGRLPLAETLSFPNRLVRIRAALALGNALPTQTFLNYQNLMPVLSEALMLYGGARNALVVDGNAESANAVAGALRAQGYEVLTDAALFAGLAKAREQTPGVDVIFVASDISEPALVEGLGALRSEFRFASAPVVLLTKPGGAPVVRDLLRADHRLAAVAESPSPAEVTKAVAEVSHAVGAQAITPELGATLAKETTEVLRLLALTNNPVFNVADAEIGLLTALSTGDPELRVALAQVLGYLGSSKAQEAIARLALEAKESEDMRVKMFAALAEAAKRRGNLLPADVTQQIVKLAESEPNMTLRQAASQALGALNLPGEPASTIIRNQYRG